MTKQKKTKKIFRYVAVHHFYILSNYLIPIFDLSLLVFGVVGGLYLAPADYQQGEAFRIIYVHVPSAFLSLLVYFIMAVFSVIGLIFRIKLAGLIVSGSVFFRFMVYFFGVIHGKCLG